MGLKQIFQNFSLDTLLSLPPSELLALVVLCVAVVVGAFLLIAAVFD